MTTPNTNGGAGTALVGSIGNTALASHETSASAVAAQAKALVEARFVLAMHRPRNWLDVRTKILATCQRPGFAALALYGLERKNNRTGQKVIISGPSIRFAEEAARAMGNILVDPMVTYDDEEKRIVKVMVTDLETNLSWPTDIVVGKVVERLKVYPDQRVLRARQNSEGKTVYLVAATEDDLANKQASAVSKAARNGILRLLPGDIVEEAVEAVRATQAAEDQRDPQAALKKLMDAYAALGVAPSALEAYLGHPLTQMTATEREALRGIYTAMRDGQTTWAEASESGATPPAPAAASTARGTDALKAKVEQRGRKRLDEQLSDDELLAMDEQRMQPSKQVDVPAGGRIEDALTPNA